MRKLSILFVAFLFSAGMAFAQSNDASIEQVGNDNDASIEQVGNSNEADIDQSGSSNHALINQFGPINEPSVNQVGADNDASVNIGDNATDIRRSEGDIYQNGDNNTASIEIYQISSYNATARALGDISQVGDNNIAEQDIALGSSGPRTDASIDQQGDDNQAYQTVYNNVNNVDVEILQDGFGNWASQDAENSNITSLIEQFGDDNTAYTTQVGQDHDAVIYQTGNGNYGGIIQNN